MSDKYIIRNCPCFVEGIAIKGNEQKTQTCNNHKVRELTLCQDCTDCVLKQIVELCKHAYLAERHLIHKSSTFNLANGILQKLDIQKVE